MEVMDAMEEWKAVSSVLSCCCCVVELYCSSTSDFTIDLYLTAQLQVL